MSSNPMHNLTYGLFILAVRDGINENGCIINTCTQITSKPDVISFAVNKQNHTSDILLKTGEFNISILSEDVKFETITRFGMQSGRSVDKLNNIKVEHGSNGIFYISYESNAVIFGKVKQVIDVGSHNLFIANVISSKILSAVPSVTYSYYQNHIKKNQLPKTSKHAWRCKVCGYVYEGENLPPDFICPLCKHPASDFEQVQ